MIDIKLPILLNRNKFFEMTVSNLRAVCKILVHISATRWRSKGLCEFVVNVKEGKKPGLVLYVAYVVKLLY